MKHILLFFTILFFTTAIQAQPVVNENPYPLFECDINNNGFAYFDLHQADGDITLGDSSLFVSYHLSVHDAENSINALLSPYMNDVPYSDTVYAHVEDQSGGGFAVVSLDLLVQDPPFSPAMDLFQIDDNGSGFSVFDLTVNDLVILEDLNPTAYIVFYFETETNAEMNQFPITEPMVYQNIQNPQRIYVRIENLSGSCVSFDSFILSVESLTVDTFSFEDLALFPNPTYGKISLQSFQLNAETSISLYDIQGKMLFSKKMVPQNGSCVIDISSFENGVYFLKISSAGNMGIKKLIKI
ncbi:T9SS type A sorting domain-containing protein [Aequorivita sp. H23M31]|uniref:T9SS type A sorting domain-containing protein n=1 Tax=Aequorivita ciconiae TaxID=2494375 RepID=A0A410G741_9FLAO|nr:T9SS type A sorting domain-containing protein [Aequorivita sp. H23M31]QAA83119.1 T9SS type A sorting domain-containing protein [Aequorivita sp. H23M31]